MDKRQRMDVKIDAKHASVCEIPIPDEVLMELIFKYLPLCLWSSCLELVSPQFRRCVVSAYGMLKSLNMRLLFEHNGYCSNIPVYKLAGSRPKTDIWLTEILEKLLTVCPNLTELTDFNFFCDNIGTVHFNCLKKFEKLQSVTFAYLTIQTQAITKFCAASETLKKLSLIDYSNQNSIHGEIAVKKITNISVTGINVSLCWDNFGENLTTLKVDNPKMLFKPLYQYNAKVVENLRNLKSFTTDLCDRIDCELITKVVDNLQQLTGLHLEVRHYVHDTFESNLCITLDSMKDRLQSFQFNYSTYQGRFEMLQNFLFTKCSRLNNLKLSPLLFVDSAKELHRLSGSLEKVDFAAYNDHVIPIISSNLMQLSNLTELKLIYSYRSSDSDKIWENLCYLEKLCSLELPGQCICDDLLKFWDSNGNKMFERLVSLNLYNCNRVTDSGFCVLAKKAINLEVLALGKSSISDSTILALAESAKKLKSVSFVQPEPILVGEDALIILIEKCFYLKKLGINNTIVNKLRHNKHFLPFVNDVIVYGQR